MFEMISRPAALWWRVLPEGFSTERRLARPRSDTHQFSFAQAMGFAKGFTHPMGCFARSHGCDKSTRRANFPFRRRANHHYDSRHPVPEEGALAIVTERWDGIAVDAAASCARWDRRAG
jgi:hypothetical protein